MIAQCNSAVLVLTTYDTDSDVLPAIEAGATGYLLKDAPREELIRAVRAAFAGEAVLSPAVASRLMGQVRKPPPEALSQRELEVLALIADGATNRQAVRQRGHRQDPPATHLREAGRPRPSRRRRRRLPAPPPHLTGRGEPTLCLCGHPARDGVQTKAERPVMARPTIRVLISRVPS